MRRAWVGLAVLLAAGCARFQDRPLSAEKSLDAFERRTLADAGLKTFAQANHATEWPPASWDLESLTLAAFYFHPDLDVARAQAATAKAAIKTARERPNPTFSFVPEYNKTVAESDVVPKISPWSYTYSLDIPIETAGKRGYRIAQASRLTEAARWKIASAAWEVRNRLRQSLLELYAAAETERSLSEQMAIQTDNVSLLEMQLEAGAVSPFEVSQARIALHNSQLSLADAQRQRAEARAKVADALGVPLHALDGVEFSFEEFKPLPSAPSTPELRRQAALNRADLRSAMEEYAATQSALQLEIAKQYPDINLGPGYQWDKGEKIWSLALSAMLPVFSQNQGGIAEAKARREEAAAQVNALQARILGEVDRAAAGYSGAVAKAATADTLMEDLRKRERLAQSMYEAGETLKLDWAAAQLEVAANALARLTIQVEAQQALGRLENALQSPVQISAESLKALETEPAGDKEVAEPKDKQVKTHEQ